MENEYLKLVLADVERLLRKAASFIERDVVTEEYLNCAINKINKAQSVVADEIPVRKEGSA